MSTHRATAYLIVKADRRYGLTDPETGLRSVTSIKVAGSRAGRPSHLERDEVAAKVTVEIPDAAFAPFTPAALVAIALVLTEPRSVPEPRVVKP